MFRTSAVLLGLAVLAAPAFADPGPDEGSALYEARCKMCHGSGLANAPLIDKLATLENDKIVDALTNPVPMMASVVGGLTEEDKRNIAVFLTKKPMPAKDGLPAVDAE
ncbi:MAG: c-type cytochrome [Hyphomonadaceae bacterium]